MVWGPKKCAPERFCNIFKCIFYVKTKYDLRNQVFFQETQIYFPKGIDSNIFGPSAPIMRDAKPPRHWPEENGMPKKPRRDKIYTGNLI